MHLPKVFVRKFNRVKNKLDNQDTALVDESCGTRKWGVDDTAV